MTSKMTPLLARNEQFARTYAPVPLGLPAAQVIILTCLDHRADPGFRHQAATATGVPEAQLEASAVGDPYATVTADVERLLTSPLLPPGTGVSGHVYDIETGRVTTAVDTRYR
jgi:carbonic anhydrase